MPEFRDRRRTLYTATRSPPTDWGQPTLGRITGSILVYASYCGHHAHVAGARTYDDDGGVGGGTLHGLVRRMGEPGDPGQAFGRAMAENGQPVRAGRTTHPRKRLKPRAGKLVAKGYPYSLRHCSVTGQRADAGATRYACIPIGGAPIRGRSGSGDEGRHPARDNPGHFLPEFEASRRCRTRAYELGAARDMRARTGGPAPVTGAAGEGPVVSGLPTSRCPKGSPNPG